MSIRLNRCHRLSSRTRIAIDEEINNDRPAAAGGGAGESERKTKIPWKMCACRHATETRRARREARVQASRDPVMYNVVVRPAWSQNPFFFSAFTARYVLSLVT